MSNALQRSALALVALSLWVATPGGARDGAHSRLSTLAASAADFELGVAAHRNGELSQAHAAYTKAIEKDPNFVEAMVNLARVLIDQENFDAAEKWLIEAKRVRRDYPGIEAARGLLALRRGEPTRAAQALSDASADMPDDPEIHINLGAALLRQGRAKEAIDLLDRALRLDPTNSAAALNLALAHDLVSDPQRAAYFYRRFLETSPRHDPDRSSIEERIAQLRGTSPQSPSPISEPSQPVPASISPIAADEGELE